MSGPTRSEQIWMKDPEQLVTAAKIDRFRTLADRVERNWIGDFNDSEQVAELLRAKADTIEAALRTVEKQTQHDDFQTLIKAIEWTDSGDYGPGKIQEAWDSYGEK